jgi:hypothetical protein
MCRCDGDPDRCDKLIWEEFAEDDEEDLGLSEIYNESDDYNNYDCSSE